MSKIFISYSFNDSAIANSFFEELRKLGHEDIFLAGDSNSLAIGQVWAERVADSIKSCEYFLLLMSPSSVKSEMVVQEVNLAIKHRSKSDASTPYILPVRLNLPFDTELDYNLGAKIHRFQQRLWKGPEDTQKLVSEIADVIKSKSDTTIDDNTLNEPSYIKADGKVPVAKVGIDIETNENSEYYVVRREEPRIFKQLEKNNVIIKIKGPSQYGKGHILKRLMRQASASDYKVIALDFSGWSDEDFSSMNNLFKKFCYESYRKLNRESGVRLVNEYWELNDDLTPKENTRAFYTQHIYTDEGKVLLAINDIDCIFAHKNASNEFCSMLRSWYNDSEFPEMKIALSYSTDTRFAISDNSSPFNVGGDAYNINPFTLEEVSELCRKYDSEINEETVSFIYKTFGGHPYLTKSALAKLYIDQIPLDELQEKLIFSNGPFNDHLRKLSSKINTSNSSETIKKLNNGMSIDGSEFFILSALGIITGQFNKTEWSNYLYETFFKEYY